MIWTGRDFTVEWGSGDLRKRNVFSIHSTLYTLPTADIPVEPLVTERQARETATQALKDKYPGGWQERREVSDNSAAKRGFTIDEISLCIQQEFLSFGKTIDADLFDPVYEFAEYRLLWIALDKEAFFLVKMDAITGEILTTYYYGGIT